MRNILRGSCAAALLVLVASPAALCLEFGDKAPEALDVSEWVQGEPLELAAGAGKSVYVVEFVQTFKPECQKALDAAVKLHDKHRAKGLEIVAVSTESAAEVKAYLAEHKAPYRFAVDENRNAIVEWAGEEPYLPYAVVVDKAGVVVFTGNPMYGMEKLVDDVMAGKFDAKKAVKVRTLRDQLNEAWSAGEWDRMDAVCDELLGLDSSDTWAFDRRCDGFERRENLEGYRKFVKSFAERAKDDGKMLAHIARRLIFEGRINWRDPELAITTARRAAEVSKGAEAGVLDTYASVLCEIGLLDEAVVEQKKAVALDAENKYYKQKLAFLETCAALRAKQQGATRPK